MEQLYNTMRTLLSHTSLNFKRYKFKDLNPRNRMFGIVGPRGVGKTTMILQYIKELPDTPETLYVSADNMYFSSHTLLELADRFVKQNGRNLFIDEIHKYANWSQELKQMYDTMPELHIGFTGSSVLDIYKGAADLSRRAPIYEMQGLSFREYLYLFHNIEVPVYSLDSILKGNITINDIEHPLPLFNDYLRRGYYPFGLDAAFNIELQQVINQTMETDIPTYAEMNVSTGKKLKQLLAVIAESVPFKPNASKLAEMIGISRNNLSDYMYYIERAGMIAQVKDSTGGIRGLGKIEKVYLDNTNIAYSLGQNNTNIGNIRETFFYNQMRVNNPVIASKISDFEIDGMTFEIGGRKKGQRQIEGLERAYIVKDDIEYGYGNVVPLWAFGLNY